MTFWNFLYIQLNVTPPELIQFWLVSRETENPLVEKRIDKDIFIRQGFTCPVSRKFFLPPKKARKQVASTRKCLSPGGPPRHLQAVLQAGKPQEPADVERPVGDDGKRLLLPQPAGFAFTELLRCDRPLFYLPASGRGGVKSCWRQQQRRTCAKPILGICSGSCYVKVFKNVQATVLLRRRNVMSIKKPTRPRKNLKYI